ncbi:hypothetical protein J6590_091775 [Homalodisca vitripennis]|nr:hypothetical protein J6590_091775 [Homalodisca vitripennis]
MQLRRAAGDTFQFQTLALKCLKNSLSTVVSVNNNLKNCVAKLRILESDIVEVQWRRAAGDTFQFKTLALQCVKNSLSTVVSVNNNLKNCVAKLSILESDIVEMQWRRAAGDTFQFQTLALQCVKNSLSTVVSKNCVAKLRILESDIVEMQWIRAAGYLASLVYSCACESNNWRRGDVSQSADNNNKPFRKQVFVVTGDGFSSLTPALCSCLVAVELTVELSDATLRLHGLTRCRSVLLISAVVTLCHLLLVNVSALDYFAFETTEQSDLENIETG